MREKSDSKGLPNGKSRLRLLPAVFLSIILAVLAFTIPAEGLDSNMRGALAVFMVAAVLWISEAIPLYLTSFVIVLMEVMLIDKGVFSASDALQPFFNTLIALFFGGFVLSIGLNKYGLDAKMARYILSKAGKSPGKILIGMMGMTAFLSMWMSNTATTALMMAMALPIYRAIPPGNRFKKALVLGIPFAANIGGMGTPIGTPPNAIIINELAEGGYNITFFQWMMMTVPVMLVLLAISFVILFYAFRPEKNDLPVEDISCEGIRSMDGKQFYVLGIFVLTAVLWLFSSTKDVKNLFQSSGIIALIPVIAFFGAGILDKRDLRKVNWDVLLLMGGGMSLGSAVKATSLDIWIMGHIDHSSMSFFVLVLVFALAAILLSTFMSNTSTAALMAPIVLTVAVLSSNPIGMMVALALACSMAMALPVSTPPNAIAYGTEEVEVKDMMIYGSLIGALGVLVILIFLAF